MTKMKYTIEDIKAALDSGMKPAAIAREVNKSPQTILNFMNRHGLKRLSDKLTTELLERAIIVEGRTRQDVAGELKIDITTVNRFIKKHNLKLDVCAHCGNQFHSPKNTVQHCSPECLAWSHVDKRDPNECWPYIGKQIENGYGRIRWKGRQMVAHRVIWEITKGEHVSEDLDLRHLKCPSGIQRRLCCNPDHLKPGTRSENIQDSVKDGTWANRYGRQKDKR
jgi:hypothetical protein